MTEKEATKPTGKPPTNYQGGDGEQGDEPPRALLSISPSDDILALAVDKELRVFDKRTKKLQTLLTGEASTAVVRCIAFSQCGNFFAAGTDDKTLRLYKLSSSDSSSWSLFKTVKFPKKLSAIVFTKNGNAILAANKFGDVLAVSTTAETVADATEKGAEFELALGHYCSVVTSLSLSADGTLLASTDRDGKVRVSILPENPLLGAHEIQSFAFGHTDFVSCAVFVGQRKKEEEEEEETEEESKNKEVLISGGGDGTVRLWDPFTGRQLSVLQVGGKQEEAENEEEPEKEEEEAAAGGSSSKSIFSPFSQPVLALCASADGGHLVVALDGVAEVVVVRIDVANEKLEEVKRCAVPGGLPFATDILMTKSGKFLFVSGPLAGVPSAAPTAALLACAELDASSGALVEVEFLSNEAAQQLQQLGNKTEGEEREAPRKFLPKYLHKRTCTLTFEEKAARKVRKLAAADAASGAAAAAAAKTETAAQ